MEENLPPGFRFHPTDEELITYYLTSKVSDFTFQSRAITEVDLNKCEPWDLPGKAQMGEKEWYFFSLKDRKYPTGIRTNRATDAGYWKTTGKDKEIFHSRVLVGMKKTLVFYLGRAPRGEKSNWVMHEYRLETRFSLKPIKEEWVVCRVFEKSSTGKKQQQTSSSPASHESPCDTATMVNEHGGIELPNFSDLPDLYNDHNNNSAAINLNHNWVSAMEATNLPSFSWSSSLLGSNFSINSTLFRALPFSGYKPQGAMNHDHSYVQDENSHFGADLSSNLMASSSKIMDSIQQQEYNDPGSNIW